MWRSWFLGQFHMRILLIPILFIQSLKKADAFRNRCSFENNKEQSIFDPEDENFSEILASFDGAPLWLYLPTTVSLVWKYYLELETHIGILHHFYVHQMGFHCFASRSGRQILNHINKNPKSKCICVNVCTCVSNWHCLRNISLIPPRIYVVISTENWLSICSHRYSWNTVHKLDFFFSICTANSIELNDLSAGNGRSELYLFAKQIKTKNQWTPSVQSHKNSFVYECRFGHSAGLLWIMIFPQFMYICFVCACVRECLGAFSYSQFNLLFAESVQSVRYACQMHKSPNQTKPNRQT